MKKVLVLVDCQKDFMNANGKLYVPDAENIKKNILRLVNDNNFDQIIVTKDTHDKETYASTEEAKIFPPHCLLCTSGHGLFDELAIALKTKGSVMRITKGYFDIWKESAFHDYVHAEMTTDDELTIVGVATNYCVFYNVAGFIKQGFKNISVPSNCVKEIPDDTFQKTLNTFKQWGIKSDAI